MKPRASSSPPVQESKEKERGSMRRGMEETRRRGRQRRFSPLHLAPPPPTLDRGEEHRHRRCKLSLLHPALSTLLEG